MNNTLTTEQQEYSTFTHEQALQEMISNPLLALAVYVEQKDAPQAIKDQPLQAWVFAMKKKLTKEKLL